MIYNKNYLTNNLTNYLKLVIIKLLKKNLLVDYTIILIKIWINIIIPNWFTFIFTKSKHHSSTNVTFFHVCV